jgi:hypothetical protein
MKFIMYLLLRSMNAAPSPTLNHAAGNTGLLLPYLVMFTTIYKYLLLQDATYCRTVCLTAAGIT